MKPTMRHAQAKKEALEAKVKEWGIDLKKFKARAAKAKGSAKDELKRDVVALRTKLEKANAKLQKLMKSGDAAAGELKKGFGRARANLKDSLRKAKAELK